MVVKAPSLLDIKSIADLHEQLGYVPLDRIRLFPSPGTATMDDLIRTQNDSLRRCELVDGSIVEKEPMGAKEALFAMYLGGLISRFAEEHDLGVVLGPDGLTKMDEDLVRIPDLSFVPWSRIPNEEFPDDAISKIIPTLTVEIVSRSNSEQEIARRLNDFFKAGVKLVWVIDPRKHLARVYTSETRYKVIDETGTLDGGRVLPGFKLPLIKIFSSTRRRPMN